MSDTVTRNHLKDYLKNEYLKLSDEKDEILMKKVQLEVENQKEEEILFDLKQTEKIKMLFSPLSLKLTNFYDSSKIENEVTTEIQKLENNVNQLQNSMDELKSYLSYIQKLEWEEEDSIIKDNEKPMISENLQDMLVTTLEFLKGQYERVEFLMDMMEEPIYSDSEFNHNLVRILTYTVSSTIESKKIDTVILEVSKEENRINVSLQLLVNDEIMDQYDYQFSLYIKS